MVSLHVFYWSKQGQTCPYSRGQDIDPTSQGEEWLRIWDSHLQHYLISFPSDNLLRKYELQPYFTDEDTEVQTANSRVWAPNHCPPDSLPIISDALLCSEGSPTTPTSPNSMSLLSSPLSVGLPALNFLLSPSPTSLHQPQGLGWKFQERQHSEFCQSLMSATYGLFTLYWARVGMTFVLWNPHCLGAAAMVPNLHSAIDPWPVPVGNQNLTNVWVSPLHIIIRCLKIQMKVLGRQMGKW